MVMAMIENVAVTELIWTLAGLPGLITWLSNLRNVANMRRAARLAGDLRTRVIAGTLFRLGLAGSIVSAILVMLGLFGMTQPQVTARITALGWAFTVGIVLIAAITTLVGIDIRRATAYVWRMGKVSNIKGKGGDNKQ